MPSRVYSPFPCSQTFRLQVRTIINKALGNINLHKVLLHVVNSPSGCFVRTCSFTRSGFGVFLCQMEIAALISRDYDQGEVRQCGTSKRQSWPAWWTPEMFIPLPPSLC